MKKIFFVIVPAVLATIHLKAQGGFTKIVDAQNPVTTFSSPGFYKGAAWIDFDNDNDIDLFAAPNFLFRNDGNGIFTQVVNPFGFTPQQNPGGSSWADLNNDGFIDCIIAQYPSGVYLNNGNGNFINVSGQIPNLNGFPAWACAVGNWNNDPYLDFVFTHAAGFHPVGPFPSRLYLNTNASVMPEYITGYVLTDSTGPYTVPYWSDYDLDGDMDLFVASGPGGTPGPDFCYKNLKMETGFDSLQRMTTEIFATQLQDGQCYNFIDYDNDGDLDLCLTNYAGAPTRFYINNGGVYSLVAMSFSAQTKNLTNDWGDFDNDGDLDVMITNDLAPTKFYKNNGDGTFAPAISLGIAGGSGIANGDYDNDGDLDVFIHGNGNARALFRNDSVATGNHWVNIRCIGMTSNKSAIGTVVRMKATINGISYWQMREITAQNSFQSENDLRVHFGLGNATGIDSLQIKYPSGDIEAFINVAPDIFYCNEEGSGNLCLATAIHEEGNNFNPIKLYPNPVNDFITIDTKNLSDDKEINIRILDAFGKMVKEKTLHPDNRTLCISVSDLIRGIYLMEASGSIHFKEKFIKVGN
jgi:hypothetical protein